MMRKIGISLMQRQAGTGLVAQRDASRRYERDNRQISCIAL